MAEYRFSGYTLDGQRGKLLSPTGEELNLSSRALITLQVLVEHRGVVLSKAQLLEAVWPGQVVEDNNLNQAISSLRKALGDSKAESRFIQTVPGRGYRFVAALDAEPSASDGEAAKATRAMGASGAEQGGEATATEVAVVATAPVQPPAGAEGRAGAFAAVAGLLALGLLGLLALFGEGSSEATRRGDMPSAALASFATEAQPLDNSIAVLPFASLDGGADNELFTVGLHDEIINQLAKIGSLQVISRSSVYAIAGKTESVAEVGRILGVESVMTGTMMYLGDRARVSLQLVDPRTDLTLWADSYETDLGDLPELVSLQRDIALSVAAALEAEVRQQEQVALESLPTRSFSAYRYNLAAQNAYFNLDYSNAWTLSRQALAADPDYYSALYHFASVNTVLIGLPLPGMGPREHAALAMEAVQRMIALAPERTEGHALKAAVHSTYREWDQVAEEMAILRELDAPLAELRFLASVLLLLGDFQGAIDILQANLRAEPVNLYARGFLMMAHELQGNRLQARQEYALGEELTPQWWGDSVNIFLALGRGEELQDIDELSGLSPRLRRTLHSINAGDPGETESLLREYLEEDSASIAAETLYYSAVAAVLGQHELALKLMEEAVQDVWLTLHWFWLPVFDEVRRLAGFEQLLVEAGVVDYWRARGWPRMCRPAGDGLRCDWRAYP